MIHGPFASPSSLKRQTEIITYLHTRMAKVKLDPRRGMQNSLDSGLLFQIFDTVARPLRLNMTP